MKNLKDLANEIEKEPKDAKLILSSFRTSSLEIKNFLFSLQDIPAYLIPALLRTFQTYHKESEPKTVKDLMESSTYLNSLFVLVEDGTDWMFVGVSISGKPLGRPFNSHLVLQMNPEKEIKYVF